jgi:hypothetical protein
MNHTIVTWDCSYRAFHHLIDALVGQDYPTGEWELIYVEQRTKRVSNARVRKQGAGLQSLWEHYQAVKDDINMQVVYVGDRAGVPYHPGRCINAGLGLARSDVVSVMDGDQLLQPHFLKSLDAFHDGRDGIASVHCHVASGPVGATEGNWTEATFDFGDVLALCPYGDAPYPAIKKPGSYGSMVSARRRHWEVVGGMDEHPLWATSASMVISDAAYRLERLLGAETELLQDTFSVHPWHPHGYGRKGRARGDEDVRDYLNLQRVLMADTKHHDWRTRTPVADRLCEANRELVDRVHWAELRMMS